jgi:toxin ParE1/3/4
MKLRVVLRQAALREFIDAAARYEAHRARLGNSFIAEIERCIELASTQPDLFPEIHTGVRRVVAKRFPYSVYFRREEHRIVVLAIFHGSRNPEEWQQRR